MGKDRIGRIAKGEKVVVQVLSEDLQDKFNDLKEARLDSQDAGAAAAENSTLENHEKYERLKAAATIKRAQFWLAIREKYGYWDKALGVRDGYALVTMAEREMPDFLKKLLGGLGGGE